MTGRSGNVASAEHPGRNREASDVSTRTSQRRGPQPAFFGALGWMWESVEGGALRAEGDADARHGARQAADEVPVCVPPVRVIQEKGSPVRLPRRQFAVSAPRDVFRVLPDGD